MHEGRRSKKKIADLVEALKPILEDRVPAFAVYMKEAVVMQRGVHIAGPDAAGPVWNVPPPTSRNGVQALPQQAAQIYVIGNTPAAGLPMLPAVGSVGNPSNLIHAESSVEAAGAADDDERTAVVQPVELQTWSERWLHGS